MTAIISTGASPLSILDEDDSMSWHWIESSTGMGANSLHSADQGSFDDVGAGNMFFDAGSALAPSPSIVSQGSYGVVGYNGHPQQQHQNQRVRSFTTPSPHDVDDFHTASYSPTAAFGPVSTADMTGRQGAFVFDLPDVAVDMPHQPLQQPSFLDHPILEGRGEEAPSWLTQGLYAPPNPLIPEPSPETMLPESIFAHFDLPGFGLHHNPPSEELQQNPINGAPWDPVGPPNVVFEPGHLPTPGLDLTPGSEGSRRSISLSPQVSAEVTRLLIGLPNDELHAIEPTIHDIPKKSPGIQKSKRKSRTPPRFKSPDRKFEDGMFKFCNQTPDTFGKASFGEMEQLDRSSQKGRKGALSEEVRASALNVRKQGACFCCHVRKVKCDEQRPCKNCVKLCTQVPGAACWKFSEFTTILFPTFLRQHFEKAEMNQFVKDNIASFTINGVDTPCTVTLSSGNHFVTKLTVKAKFFTPWTPTSDITQHWGSIVADTEKGVEMERYPCAPIGLDIMDNDTGGTLRAELKRKIMAYMEGLTGEEHYAVQLSDITKDTTKVPMQVLQLVQRYAQQAPEGDAAMVRRALGILVLQHVMTRHLTLTPQSIAEVQRFCPYQLTGPYVTSRLLGRQIKQVVDECLKDLVPMLFDDFLKRLKSKSRKEWAPCVAAFLVFCILMELMEGAADTFAIAENEIEMRKDKSAKFSRALALEANRRIENMPFKQFAYQFHQIYQTHSQDASAKSFNPLHDNARNDLWDLEPAAMGFVRGLREGIDGNFPFISRIWRGSLSLQFAEGELDWLTFDPILPPSSEGEDYPWPRDIGGHYMGRLVATFLLSFRDKNYLFTAT